MTIRSICADILKTLYEDIRRLLIFIDAQLGFLLFRILLNKAYTNFLFMAGHKEIGLRGHSFVTIKY